MTLSGYPSARVAFTTGAVAAYPFSGPYEDVKLKGK